jgi:hypothetical protein
MCLNGTYLLQKLQWIREVVPIFKTRGEEVHEKAKTEPLSSI